MVYLLISCEPGWEKLRRISKQSGEKERERKERKKETFIAIRMSGFLLGQDGHITPGRVKSKSHQWN